MSKDRGTILINAVVVVLAIAAIAAGLLTRSEAARIRAGDAQLADQLDLYLDAGERLAPGLLEAVDRDAVAHPGQAWSSTRVFPIDRGEVSVQIVDLQGRLNANWLLRNDEDINDAFDAVFSRLNVPRSLRLEIADFLSPSGPRGTAYLSRTPPVWPRGGSAFAIEDLREVQGMEPRYFDSLRTSISALPSEAKLNINTAPPAILAPMITGFPSELQSEILDPEAPFTNLSDLRALAVELLETEEVDFLPFDRLTVSSQWFRATLTAELDGRTAKRVVILRHMLGQDPPFSRHARWAVYD
ncbi:MAG: type II secretion system minor pseudopilin GspK [Pseudomonadota bacterium]